MKWNPKGMRRGRAVIDEGCLKPDGIGNVHRSQFTTYAELTTRRGQPPTMKTTALPLDRKELVPELQEQNPTEARFARIEGTLETIAGTMADIAAAQKNTEYALTEAVEAMEREHKRLLIAQDLMYDAQTKADERIAKLADALAATEAKHAGEHDDLKDKLHVLYDVVDRWIREKGGKNGPLPPETPAGA